MKDGADNLTLENFAGKATDDDPSAWDGALAIVRIGTDKRSEDELARLADQRVAVEGRLVLHPPIADPNVASPTPGPTLFDVGAITPALTAP